jgi:hypothetical protein
MRDTPKTVLIMIGLFLSVHFFTLSEAKNPAPKAKKQDSAKKVYWDHWYKVTVQNRIRYAFYRETVDESEGKIRFAVNMKKLEDGFFNEENMAAFSKNDNELTPLFFNFRSMVRTTETVMDGTISDSQNLAIKIRRNNVEQPLIQKKIPKGTLFSSFFPLWLNRNLSKLKPLQPASFQTFLEDKPDLGFRLESGLVRLEKPDELSQKSSTQKLAVDYLGNRSIWYVKPNGSALRIEIPLQNLTVDLTTQSEAEIFLQK